MNSSIKSRIIALQTVAAQKKIVWRSCRSCQMAHGQPVEAAEQ